MSKKQFNRRDFLKASGATLVTVAAGFGIYTPFEPSLPIRLCLLHGDTPVSTHKSITPQRDLCSRCLPFAKCLQEEFKTVLTAPVAAALGNDVFLIGDLNGDVETSLIIPSETEVSRQIPSISGLVAMGDSLEWIDCGTGRPIVEPTVDDDLGRG